MHVLFILATFTFLLSTVILLKTAMLQIFQEESGSQHH